jgi:two-component system, cell cycle sensor histidine kinase and response regulator CckA
MRDVILVVDDEPFVLNIVSNVLQNAGYTVLRASSAPEALEIARAHHDPIRLLLADVIMPGLSGPSLAEIVMDIHPETECMFMAGLPDSPEICDRILRRGFAFLPKPFIPGTLVSKVKDLLGGDPVPESIGLL